VIHTDGDLELATIRGRFPALARPGPGGQPFVWADAPGGSQAPDTVIEAIAGRMRQGASNTHGVFTASREIDALIDDARVAGADLLGCDPGEVVFGPNATTILLHLSRSFARTIGPGDEVVVTRLDHDANIRPWILAARDAGATVRWADVRTDDVTLDLSSLTDAIGPRTKLVACTLASNAVGSMPDVAEVVALAKGSGAIVALDGVHFTQHHAPRMHAWGADIVATSPYKFFGPHQGMVGVRAGLLAGWEPYKLDAADDIDPSRWETGTQSHEALAGTVAAIDYLAGLGTGTTRSEALHDAYDRMATHERALARRFLEGIEATDGLTLYGIADPARVGERTPTFAIRVGDEHPVRTAEALAERGINTWDGHYYAIEVFRRLRLLETGGAVRIGFCHYHTTEEVDRVVEALAGLA
jgi:cysteine desulfurase family protein (TIGR01976 family)